ncbi:hypothetical protein L107_13850 [Cyanobium sp. Copco_Reservoir_LC18]|uniref:hypothetical protein n=1 Tax=Cyanobium sp. Copco_Reservoir_LC18 TaxID=1328305 RepID=UPI00135740DA|nr:hypothetical protein [Cyanobium sp. Copco_Reservoir_LC18]KAF0652397.1 hypothetical protein L107_13850 [Cyanobium sp. Copco_Reservoir_LC18]
MKNTDMHPVELLLLAAVVTLEALLVLTVALVALVLTLARWRPAVPAPAATTEAPPPAVHPLALVAEQLEALPVAQLRPMAGTRSKRIRKHQLVAALVAC